jgi:hypothetical protein
LRPTRGNEPYTERDNTKRKLVMNIGEHNKNMKVQKKALDPTIIEDDVEIVVEKV